MMLAALFFLLTLCLREGLTDNPCAARFIDNQSAVCVCTSDYCDDIVREPPSEGGYVSYTSSKGGLRFYKFTGDLEEVSSDIEHTMTIDPKVKYQSIAGFGGSVTDAAGINWKNLSQSLQNYLIESYFGETGLQYNMLRIPIGGCDFSTHPYAYNELPENDYQLTNFSLSVEDDMYKIPMIKEIIRASGAPVYIVSTTWSPPVWMKSNHNITGQSHLKEECYQSYADYHLKFIEQYDKEGIPIWSITTTNEVQNGRDPRNAVPFNSLGWSPEDMGKWIINNLGPTIRNSAYKDLKILTMDDQRLSIVIWFDVMVQKYPEVLDYIDGVAVHWYQDFLRSLLHGSLLADVPKRHPGKFVLATEASEGTLADASSKVLLGSWDRAQTYTTSIIEDLTNEVVGWLDWNLCLNSEGGPNWAGGFVDSPVIVMPENDEFLKQPMFYAMGHFSKFIPRCSKRVKVTEDKSLYETSVDNLAVFTRNGTVVIVLHNIGSERTVAVRLGDKQANVYLDADSITTVELPYQSSPDDDYQCEFE